MSHVKKKVCDFVLKNSNNCNLGAKIQSLIFFGDFQTMWWRMNEKKTRRGAYFCNYCNQWLFNPLCSVSFDLFSDDNWSPRLQAAFMNVVRLNPPLLNAYYCIWSLLFFYGQIHSFKEGCYRFLGTIQYHLIHCGLSGEKEGLNEESVWLSSIRMYSF